MEAVSAGWWQTCAIAHGGSVLCWGNLTGDPSETIHTSSQPGIVSLDGDIAAIAAGHSHSCAIHEGDISCWGAETNGQLGNGNSSESVVLAPQRIDEFSGGASATAVSAGYWFSAAGAGPNFFVWGDNAHGQLGAPPDPDARTSPVEVEAIANSGASVLSVSAGWRHICAIIDGGQVQCWGGNDSGQLGRTDGANHEPSPVDGLSNHGWQEVDAGWGGHSCARSPQEGVYCWGNNDNGQIGVGNDTSSQFDSAQPVLSEPIADVAVGESHTCALTESGELYCWGDNGHGQLGVGATPAQSAQPLAVGTP